MDNYRPSKRPRLGVEESGRTTCLYCDRRIPIEEHQRHRFEKHFDLQFKCSPCIEMLSTLHQGHFPSLDQLKKHLGEVHGETEVDNEDKLQELIRSGMIILPSDLRSLDCRFCEGKKILLGQDRMAMAIHIRHRHNMKIPRHVFKYQCRMCHEEFKTSENLLSEEHQCQQLLAQFQESARSNTIGMEERGEESEIAAAGPSSSSVSSNGELCHYCPTEYPVENKASHRGKHLDLDFLCGKCTRSFPYLEDIKHHLSKDHELVVEADDGVDGKHLADNGWLVMPKDLRVIQCPECQQPFLAQDRQTVLSHLKRMHGKVVGGQEKGLINYGCRSCNKTDFSNSAEVFEHDCLPKSKYDRNAIGGELALRSSEELLPLTDLEWNTEDMQVPNDLRRMACRLCGFQVNGQRFFKMVHHLEEKHDKYQQCRAYKLDFFVKFGCGHCPQFQCESVHTWDKHFQDDYCTKCAGMSSSDDAISACSDNVTNGVDATVAEKKNKVMPNDIRLLICKICSATFPKRGFEDIQAHLKLEHTQEIVDSPKLSDFVDFGCIKCPKYSPQSLVEWKDHFHLRNTTCNESHAALVAAANLSNLELDCRRLACKMCNLNFVVSDYYVLCKHLETHHNIDTKPSANLSFKEVFDFQCHRCPNFKPEDKHRWDRHFSSDNQFCQGSGKVQVLLGGKSRVLYWCDACQETRENIQAHFTGSSHRAAIEALLLSNSITNNIIRCDPCSISFTSQGNFDLHLEGDYHREKQTEASNSDTIKSTSASSTIIDDDVIVNNAAVCI